VNGGGDCPRAAEAARGQTGAQDASPAPLGARPARAGDPVDRRTPTVAIIGGGASGALVAANLLRRRHAAGMRIVVIERRHELARGVAYSTTHPEHRLNVPAAEMGVWPDDQRHFVRWAAARGIALAGREFAPRGLFGEYLADVLAEARRSAERRCSLEVVRDAAVGISVAGRSEAGARPVVIELASGGEVAADRAVLAIGNLAPAAPPGADDQVLASDRYEPDPWDEGVGKRAAGDRSILLIGTGLTMVDVALALGERCPDARMVAVSRSGLLPRRHSTQPLRPARTFRPIPLRPKLYDIVRRVEAEAEAEVRKGGDWRAVIDSLRPVTNELWTRLSEADRRRFVERYARRWDVHRHRMAPEVAALLDRLRGDGRLEIEAAGCVALRVRDDGIEVELLPADAAEPETRRFDRVVNCTGPTLDLRAAGEPLLDDLFARGLARPGPIGLGLDHDPLGALVGADGRVSSHLFAIGPLRKGRLWETTAIPEIRQQAAELAAMLAGELGRSTTTPPRALAS
jgi:uncharacterized NAD(P)/FAD-binding protein YdhS